MNGKPFGEISRLGHNVDCPTLEAAQDTIRNAVVKISQLTPSPSVGVLKRSNGNRHVRLTTSHVAIVAPILLKPKRWRLPTTNQTFKRYAGSPAFKRASGFWLSVLRVFRKAAMRRLIICRHAAALSVPHKSWPLPTQRT